MLEQDEQMIGIDQCLLGRTLEEIFRMMGEELVERTGRGDHDCRRGGETAARATRLLPRRSDGPRVADEDRRAQPADVDSQFQCVRSNDSFYSSFSEPFFDLATLGRQIAASIAADGGLEAGQGIMIDHWRLEAGIHGMISL